MKAIKVTFFVYGGSEEEARRLEEALYEFVSLRASRGVAVTAEKLTRALHDFGQSPIIDIYLNGK